MCFSPEASFAVGTGLAAIGVMALRKVVRREELLFASIPLLFASQQFVEGMLWLVLLMGGMPAQQYWLTQVYGGYAGIVWPIVASLSIFLIEHDRTRKRLMVLGLLVGAVTVFSTIKIIGNGGFSSDIVNHCIYYDYAVPQKLYGTWWSYVIATTMAFLLSGQRVIRWLGIVNLATFLIAYRLYDTAYISVWCFFAAVTSAFIYVYFSRTRKAKADALHSSEKRGRVMPLPPIH